MAVTYANQLFQYIFAWNHGLRSKISTPAFTNKQKPATKKIIYSQIPNTADKPYKPDPVQPVVLSRCLHISAHPRLLLGEILEQ